MFTKAMDGFKDTAGKVATTAGDIATDIKNTAGKVASHTIEKVIDVKDTACEMAINQLTSTSYKAVELVGQIDVRLSAQHSVFEVADFNINGHLGVTGGLSICINFKKKVSSGTSPQEEVRSIPVT